MRRAAWAAPVILTAVVGGASARPVRAHLPAATSAVRAVRATEAMVHVGAGTFLMGLADEGRGELAEACARELGAELVGVGFCEWDQQQVQVPAALHHGTVPQARRVFLHAFWIDRREVTTSAYRACVRAGACDMSPLVAGDVRYVRDDWPIVNVSWFDADTYCRWLGKRLPTEAEWEKAARGTDGRRWPWGDFEREDGANLGHIEPEALRPPTTPYASSPDGSDGAKLLVPPGSFRWGRSPYGAEDMSGNVAEWVADWYADAGYEGLPTVDPTGVRAGMPAVRVVRGGGFDLPRYFGRTYFRHQDLPSAREYGRGFRCARDD